MDKRQYFAKRSVAIVILVLIVLSTLNLSACGKNKYTWKENTVAYAELPISNIVRINGYETELENGNSLFLDGSYSKNNKGSLITSVQRLSSYLGLSGYRFCFIKDIPYQIKNEYVFSPLPADYVMLATTILSNRYAADVNFGLVYGYAYSVCKELNINVPKIAKSDIADVWRYHPLQDQNPALFDSQFADDKVSSAARQVAVGFYDYIGNARYNKLITAATEKPEVYRHDYQALMNIYSQKVGVCGQDIDWSDITMHYSGHYFVCENKEVAFWFKIGFKDRYYKYFSDYNDLNGFLREITVGFSQMEDYFGIYANPQIDMYFDTELLDAEIEKWNYGEATGIAYGDYIISASTYNTIHELTHALVMHQGRFREDNWLAEALPDYCQAIWGGNNSYVTILDWNLPVFSEETYNFLLDNPPKTMLELANVIAYLNERNSPGTFIEWPNHKRMLSTARAISLINYMINTYGKDAFLSYARHNYSEQKVFGKSFEEIRTDWYADLSARYCLF